jgi:hypothetical protein
MSERIPKPARDALAKQTAAEPHLSPDLLNAYIEQALNPAEKVQVTAHLASCGECRDVVFLASAATQELEPALLPQAMTGDLRQPALAAARTAQPQGRAVQQPKPKPLNTWWKWALPLTAVIVLGATALIERDQIADRLNPAPREMASMKQKTTEAQPSPTAAAPPELDSQTQSRARVSNPDAALSKPGFNAVKKGTRAQARLDKQEADMRERNTQAEIASNLENAPSRMAAGNAIAAQRVPSPPPSAAPVQSVDAASAAPLVQSANGGNDLTYISPEMKTQAVAKSLAADRAGALTTLEMENSPAPARTRWRISSDGHVEHMVGPSTWERVMAAEPVTFRVVATVSNNVWAGGSDGALFYSSDRGKHWDRVTLAAEQGAITSIHFNTPQQGSLTSDSGATWTTSDGGLTWTKK